MLRRSRLLAGAAAALVCGSASAAVSQPFTWLSLPIGVHVTSERMLLTDYCVYDPGVPTFYQVDASGAVTPFAPGFPARYGCVEKYLDISPGLGGFPRDWVYAIQGEEIWEISPDGAQYRLFATLPEWTFDHSGITFDRVGVFGHRIIATNINGSVYTVDAAGTVAFVANVGAFHENPEVIPPGHGPLSGRVWTAAEGVGAVFAISPDPAVPVEVVVQGLWGAESLSLVPPEPCTFGSAGALFFTSHASSEVRYYTPADLAGRAGQVMLGMEPGPMYAIAFDEAAGAYRTDLFAEEWHHHEGTSIARCVEREVRDPVTGNRYRRFDVSRSWHDAKAFCERQGAHLATVTSARENDLVYGGLCAGSAQWCWLGATDEAVEGAWTWVTGERWSYANWADGEPNDCSGIEHHLQYFTPPDGRAGFWNDLGSLGDGGCGCGCPDEFYRMSTVCEWDVVPVDVRPGSCPNPLNPKAGGVIPVAIAGTASLDVTAIDASSVRLAGVPALRASVADVTAPFEPWSGKAGASACAMTAADGLPDLVLQFDSAAVAATLLPAVDGEARVVQLTGTLSSALGGSAIEGEDVVLMRLR